MGALWIGFFVRHDPSMEKTPRRAVVVFGSGRSGTSLLMQVLAKLGMRLSKELLGPHYENQDGFFEDVQIIELHKGLLSEIGSMPLLPLPDGWIDSPAVIPYRNKIKAVVEENVFQSGNSTWCVKDPRLSSLLPLWIPIFKSLWIVPHFILTVRRPEDVVVSLTKQAKISPELAELVWLHRTCDALVNSSSNCFIVHYEDWFIEPIGIARDLVLHLHLDSSININLVETLGDVIKRPLNRASLVEYHVSNPLVTKLYVALMKCRGIEFDRSELMLTVKECVKGMNCYKGWHQLANESNKKHFDTKIRLENSMAEIKKLKLLESRIRQLEGEKSQNEQLMLQVRKLISQLNKIDNSKYQ